MEPLKVLLVDDDPDLGRMMKLLLSREAPHCSFHFAEGGRECLEYLRDNEADCILSDYQMPGMDGMQLMLTLKEQGSGVPFIFLTAQGNEEVARDALKSGASDYFTKEAGLAHFARIVNSVEQAVSKRQAELAKMRADRDWEETFDAIDDLITLQRTDYTIERGNRAACKALATDCEGIVGKKCYELYHGTSGPIPECPAAELLEGSSAVVTHEVGLGDRVFEVKVCPVTDDGSFDRFVHIAKDITARKKAEDSLLHEKKKLEAILANIGDGISIVDRDFTVVYQNRAHVEIVGPHIGEFCYQAYEHKDGVCEGCPVSESFMDGGIHSVRRSPTTDKGLKHVDITSSPLVDTDGNIVAGIEMVKDVTAKKLAEDALKESEERFRTLFESAGDAIFMMDRNTFLDCNQKAVEMFGCRDKSEIVGHSPVEFSPDKQPDGRPSLNMALEYISAALRNMPQRFYWKHTRKDGGTFDAEVSLNAFSSKWRVYLLAIVRDVTARKLAEDALRREKDFTETVLNSIPGVFYVVDDQARLVRWNKRYAENIGMKPDELRSLNVLDTVAEENRELASSKIKEVMSDRKDVTAELNVLEKGEKKVPYLCTGSPLVADGRTYLVGMGIDITERKLAEEAVANSNRALTTLLDSVNFGMMVVGRDRVIRMANRAALALMGYNDESEVVGRTCHNFICPAEAGKCPVIDLGMCLDLSERVLLSRDGERISILKSVSPAIIGGEDVLIETFVDISGKNKHKPAPEC
ncbi:MAG: PAS domain S-box protein [Nitrospirae bacterium]|nr:PAS domain S-box protein [Nitrospirota bacterium]